MTKVNERRVVPRVDASARSALAQALDVPGVVFAALIGSQARGTASALSDVDVAIWLDPGLDPADRPGLALQLGQAASEARGLLDYLDTAPLRAKLAAGVERRLNEGRFGRRSTP
ncbi:MAG: nucleotidyltransferase domain-containing protein [Solirubrobacteraceae bacterium]